MSTRSRSRWIAWAPVLADAGLDECAALLDDLTLGEAEQRCARDRVGFLASLKARGLNLKQRQSLANAVGRSSRRRESGEASATQAAPPTTAPVILRADDPRLHFSRWNWSVSATSAISALPGAYVKCHWRGPLGAVALVVDSSSATQPFMRLAFAFDGQEAATVSVPHGLSLAVITLEPALAPAAEAAATSTIEDAAPEESRAKCLGRGGQAAHEEEEAHSLVVHILASVQALDRGSPTRPLAPSKLTAWMWSVWRGRMWRDALLVHCQVPSFAH